MTSAFGKRDAVRLPTAAAQNTPPAHAKGASFRIAAIAVATGTVLALVLGGASDPRRPNQHAAEKFDGAPERPSFRPGPTTATPSYPVVSPITLCKGRYSLDHAMRETCVRMQEEAKLEVESMQLDDDVKKLCAGRYIHDWSMYATCARLQMAAKLPIAQKPERPEFDIVRKCETQWPDSVRMRDYCENEQEEARSRASGGWIDHRLAVACTGKWPHDWKMFMYCVDRETVRR
jgi:hypothetical protein